MKSVWIVAALVAAVPAVAGAQARGAAGAASDAQAAAQAQAQARAQARIEAALEQAMSAGIPVELLEIKIAEGKAKGVSVTRIAAVVERRLEVLERARAALSAHGEAVGRAELEAGADALERGVSEAALAAVRAQTPPERRAVAIAVLTELVAQGRASEEALAQVQAQLGARGQGSHALAVDAPGVSVRVGGSGSGQAGGPVGGSAGGSASGRAPTGVHGGASAGLRIGVNARAGTILGVSAGEPRPTQRPGTGAPRRP